MKINLKEGHSALNADIELLEREIGCSLPEPYLNFIGQHDGAKPDSNKFHIDGIDDSGVKYVNNSGVNSFIPVREIPSQRSYIENISSSAFPIAWDACGNFVVLDATTEAVYFWDHEIATPFEIATDFAAFIECLEPFDPSSIKLKPGQVKRVWIKPGFLESLREKGDPSVDPSSPR